MSTDDICLKSVYVYKPNKSLTNTTLFFFKASSSVLEWGNGGECQVDHSFTLMSWLRKIKQDLPNVAASGAGFWMPVSFVSYKFIPEQWIPLFTNVCSFVWTIYLSLVSGQLFTFKRYSLLSSCS